MYISWANTWVGLLPLFFLSNSLCSQVWKLLDSNCSRIQNLEKFHLQHQKTEITEVIAGTRASFFVRKNNDFLARGSNEVSFFFFVQTKNDLLQFSKKFNELSTKSSSTYALRYDDYVPFLLFQGIKVAKACTVYGGVIALSTGGKVSFFLDLREIHKEFCAHLLLKNSGILMGNIF